MDILDFAHYMLMRREHEYIQTGVFNTERPTGKDIERWRSCIDMGLIPNEKDVPLVSQYMKMLGEEIKREAEE